MNGFCKFIVVFFLPALAFAQDASLVNDYLMEYETASEDSSRAYALWQASFNSAHADAKMGLMYGFKSLKIAEAISDNKLMGDAENSIAFCYDSMGESDSAMFFYNRSIDHLEKNGYVCEVAGVYANIGGLYKKNHEFAAALASFLKAEEIQNKCEDIGFHATTLYSIGACYNSMNDYVHAQSYFNRSLKMEMEAGNICKQGSVHNGMANAFLGSQDFVSAKREYLETINCFNACGNTYSMGYAYEGMAQLYAKLNVTDSAIFYCSNALDIFTKLDVKFDMVYETTLLANYLLQDNKLRQAKELLLKILPTTYSEDLPYDRQQTLALLAQISERQKLWSDAYRYLNESMKLLDSLNMDEQKAELTELAGKYETEKRDKMIAIEQAENQKQKAENEIQKQLKYFFMFGSGLLFVLALVLLGRYRQKKKTAKLLIEKNAIIEKEKWRAEQSEQVKQQFLANMSHEIRTPMNAITGLSRILLHRPHDDVTTEYLHAIHHSGENLQVILNDILDLSKMEAGKFDLRLSSFLLRSEVNNCIQIFKEKAIAKKIDLLVFVDDEISSHVYGDSARLSQILVNLISNAIKFTLKGSVQLNVLKDHKKDEILFSVKDTGIGISPENSARIFDSFIQANEVDSRIYGGTGLGLTIARELVLRMGGELKLKSTVNEGSEFYFSIALPETSAPNQLSDGERLFSYTGTLQILIAEDNDYNYMVTKETVNRYFPNAELFRAKNGNEVCDFAQDDQYDLILMDIQMPLMDGYEATAKIREVDSKIAIIGLTASVIRSDLEKCIASGMNGYILKPFSDNSFVDEIRKVLKLDHGSHSKSHAAIFSEKEMRSLFLRFIPEKLQTLKQGFAARNLDAVKTTCHAMRPQMVRSGLKDLGYKMELMEMAVTWNNDINTLMADIISSLDEELINLQNGEV